MLQHVLCVHSQSSYLTPPPQSALLCEVRVPFSRASGQHCEEYHGKDKH